MHSFERITHDPRIMGGKPCIRGMRVTVGLVVGMLASGHSTEDLLRLYPYLEAEDIPAALQYAAWRAMEREVPLTDDEAARGYESSAVEGPIPAGDRV